MAKKKTTKNKLNKAFSYLESFSDDLKNVIIKKTKKKQDKPLKKLKKITEENKAFNWFRLHP
jgi:hypothetical protein|tara:strand:- start:10095 stop:10280 length:186 start_codon:yes stop_codon:yes gene_type:complete